MDKRQSPRFQIEVSAIMRVHGKPGPYLVTLVDVSTTGIRLSSSTAFPPGTRVTLTYRKTELTGEIRYSRVVDGDQAYLGIQVETVTGTSVQSENGEFDLLLLFGERIRKEPARKTPEGVREIPRPRVAAIE